MGKIDIKTEVQGPDEIRIRLVREDFLHISNTFRILFEICLALAGTFLGCIISLKNENKDVPFLEWFLFGLMGIGVIAFLILSLNHYSKAKAQTKDQ